MRMAVNKPLQNFVYGANSFWRLSLTQHFLKAKQTCNSLELESQGPLTIKTTGGSSDLADVFR